MQRRSNSYSEAASTSEGPAAELILPQLRFGGRPWKETFSCISKGTRISGKVDFGEMARIEGEAEGDITGDDIEIAPTAVVTARITANRLKVSGQVDGEIIARERVEVLPPARLRCS